MEDLIAILKEKCNEYVNMMNEHEVGTPYWNYCRGKKDMIEDVLVYVSENC